MRAQRDGVPVPGAPDPTTTAEAIVARVQEKEAAPPDAPDAEKADAWDFATAMEACIALDRPDEAIAWLGKYLSKVPPDAFEFASTLRQLRQIWQLPTSISCIAIRCARWPGATISVPKAIGRSNSAGSYATAAPMNCGRWSPRADILYRSACIRELQ
jgi:hypothetical protein